MIMRIFLATFFLVLISTSSFSQIKIRTEVVELVETIEASDNSIVRAGN